MRVGIVYHTVEGHTTEIAERLAAVLREVGHEAVVGNVGQGAVDASGFDAIITGGSVHVGKHHRDLVKWVKANRELLQRVPSALFSVSLAAAADDEKEHAQAQQMLEGFEEAVDWHPEMVALFGGALLYRQYGFIKRAVMRHIVKGHGGDIDTSRNYDYTDWDAVEQFARDFAAYAGGHRA
jgi:menaquinone-dependent protoporphyrinogen oxidase